MNTEEVNAAWEYAEKRHAGERYGDAPYTEHLLEVAGLALVFGKEYGDDLVTAAFLHSVLRTGVGVGDVQERFGRDVGFAVRLLGGPEEELLSTSRSGWEKEAAAMARLIKACVRLADLLECRRVNDMSRLKSYGAEHDEFVKAVFEGPEDRPGLQKILVQVLEPD
jgi:(p)ppGpp synthase/HD superfamily hydrolase